MAAYSVRSASALVTGIPAINGASIACVRALRIVDNASAPVAVNGAGDAMAALFFAHFLSTGSAAEALSRAASSLYGVLNRTAEEGAAEMLLVEAQQELVKPSRKFKAKPI